MCRHLVLALTKTDLAVQYLAILAANGIALPLSPPFPANELKYIMDQSQASMLLSSSKFDGKAQEVFKTGLEGKPKHISIQKKQGGAEHKKITLEDAPEAKGGMMLYTSGTTSRPKGVLLPISAITAQAQSLLKAWAYSPSDHLLHVLPLHHIHGTMNALLTPLLAGSTIEFLFPFNAAAVWKRFAAPFAGETGSKPNQQPITFFTVVPTVYERLLSTHSELSPEVQTASKKAISPEHLRVSFSGSAALPTPTKKKWSDLSSGNVLLERYGMTEVGMALSCGLSKPLRIDGSVGWPLPGVEARLVDTETNKVIEIGSEKDSNGKERDGEIQLRGPTIFAEYFRNEKATASEFVEGDDGKGKWFKTGDVAVRRDVSRELSSLDVDSDKSWCSGPAYFIRGRKSADIIKTGGEKVSALEVERELLSLPEIAEAAVCAVGSGQWGQKVGCVLVLKKDVKGAKGGEWTAMDMRRAMKERVAAYKIPRVMKVVDDIPKNAMGKGKSFMTLCRRYANH